MNRIRIILIIVMLTAATACSKKKTCYECTAIGQGNTYHEDVCTKGDPEDKLPASDNGGPLQWTCTER